MNASHPIVALMQQLTLQLPPSGVVLVGAGNGSGDLIPFLSELSNTDCVLVEADQVKFKSLKGTAAQKPNWRIYNEVISNDGSIIDFYKTTLSSEDSTISPAKLEEFWPNLKALKATQRESIILHELIDDRKPAMNWLLIDCLPALSIIEGAKDRLDDINVVMTRVIISKANNQLDCANLKPVQDFLESKGFRLHTVEASRHPSLGHALFVKEHCINDVDTHQESIQPRDYIHKDTIYSPSLSYYQGLAANYLNDEPPPFLLIDSKSLPRSGLHYLKNTFAQLLGDQFSFCEWYQEVGCCKKHPCSIHAYAEHANKNGNFRLRLKKSHDFEHTDPAIPPSKVLQRLVLIRDPLFILTSWFELDQLTIYRSDLLKNGIDIKKIWLMHEKELQISAYQILASVFVPPTTDECKAWLREKSQYIIQFMNDWVTPSEGVTDPYSRVVQYEEIDQYIVDILAPYRTHLTKSSISKLDHFANQKNDKFVSRSDPYSLHAKPLEAYVREKADLFKEIVEHIAHGKEQLLTKNGARLSSPSGM